MEDLKIQRLKFLSRIEYPNDQEYEELERLKEELGLQEEDIETIEPIKEIRQRVAKNREMEDQLKKLQVERKALELKLSLQREKERIEKAKNKLDGKIYCDDCKKWVYPEHFE